MTSTARIQLGLNHAEAAPFSTPRDFLMAVCQAEAFLAIGDRGHMDPRLRFSAAAGSDEHGTYSDPAGGFLVPESLAPLVLAAPAEDDPTSGRTFALPMATPSVRIPARVDKNHATTVNGGLACGRVTETSTPSAQRMEFEQITLTSPTLATFAWATNELMMDSPVSFAAVLERAFRDELASVRLGEFLHGSGVGESFGVLKSPALIAVAAEGGQTAETIVSANVINMRARVWGYARAVWIGNHDAIPQLMKLAVTIGDSGAQIPAWRPGNADEGVPDTLLGRPLYYNEQASTLGDLGDLVCVNWSEYLDGTYQSVQGISSVFVRWLEHETAFRFSMRGSGAPWWRSALTPKRSVSTLSPYVALAARA